MKRIKKNEIQERVKTMTNEALFEDFKRVLRGIGADTVYSESQDYENNQILEECEERLLSVGFLSKY